MNIAMTHYRVGETDGVSLEMDKWKKQFEKMGHNVIYISGTKGTSEAFIIPELDYYDKFDHLLNKEAFEKLDKFSEDKLKDEMIKRAKSIERQYIDLIEKNAIDLIIPNNLFCIGRSVPIVLGLYNAIKKTKIRTIYHHHDFYWERDYANKGTTEFIRNILEEKFPPKNDDKNNKHVVINKLAQKELKLRKGITSQIVPNVFDFEGKEWIEDDFNKDFKENLGIKENQIFLLQATRVVNRKAIEVAIDLVSKLNKDENREKMIGQKLYNGETFNKNTEYVLGVVGMHEGVDNYEDKLLKYAKIKKVKMIMNPDLVDHTRHIDTKGNKTYSLWDAYVYCDMITYPSIQEGWGNQFLEGVFARKPQVVFEYDVFRSDIKKIGFNIISLGHDYKRNEDNLVKINDKKINEAALEVQDYLTNKDKYYKSVDENFNKGKAKYSLKTLFDILEKLLK